MFWKYKNLFIAFFVLVSGVVGFYLASPLDVGAQSCEYIVPGRAESPPCYESAAYPASCTGVNSTWCATNYGVVVCAQQFKDVKNRTILDPVNPYACSSRFDPPSCNDAPTRQVSLGYISCQGVGTCGNGIKETGECCDGGGNCDNTCRCTTGLGTCGDGFCTGQETDATCPNDCGPRDDPGIPGNTCTQMPYTYRTSQTVMTVYQGGTASLSFEARSNPGFGNQSINYRSTCLPGATCPSAVNLNIDTTEWTGGSVNIITNTSVMPGTYNVPLSIVSNTNSGCAVNLQYTVIVKPSRKMVCDGGWYEIPPGNIPDINSGPLVLWNNGPTNNDKYFKATYNGRYYTQVNQTTWANNNFSTKCVYTNGLTDTCTWDLPVVMPNTGAYGYPAVYGWPSNSGTMGTTASAVDSNTPNNRNVTLRRNGNKFEYSCTNNSSPTPICDNSWRYLPPDRSGATPDQTVGIYVSGTNTQYRDSVVMVARATGAGGTGALGIACRFNGTNVCNWDSGWFNLGAITLEPLFLRASSSLSVLMKTTWASGNVVENYNDTSWRGWVDRGADNNISWGQPFRTQDKLGRYWQFRTINGSVAYACGATPVCVTLNYDSTKSSISKTNLASGEAFTVKCDYGVRGIDAAGVTTGGGATCAFSSWDNGNNSRTTANFNCTAGNVGGTFPISCTNIAGTSSNVCAQSNSLGNITVTAPPSATADISANPTTIPYNTPATITWSSTNATSCSIDPTGWTGTSGNRSTGNLVSSRTYSVSCLPAGMNSTDSVTVNVQVPNQYILNVVRSGQGTVTSNPTGINCGSDCSESFAQDTNVVLTATPASGRIFTGWTVQGGGSCPGTGTCTVTMTSGKTVTANFALNPNFIEF